MTSAPTEKTLGYHLFAWLTHHFLKLFTRVVTSGLENIPAVGAVLVAGNHISHFDPYYMGPPVPRKVNFMAMEEFFKIPLIGLWLRSVDVFPVKRRTDALAARETIRRLKQGRLVFIYPERGLRASATSMLGGAPMPKGTMALAHRLRVAVIPCVIIGSDRLYQWRDWFRRNTVWIRYGAPLIPRDGESVDDFQHHYIRSMKQLFEAMIRDYGLTEDDLPASPQRRMGKAL